MFERTGLEPSWLACAREEPDRPHRAHPKQGGQEGEQAAPHSPDHFQQRHGGWIKRWRGASSQGVRQPAGHRTPQCMRPAASPGIRNCAVANLPTKHDGCVAGPVPSCATRQLYAQPGGACGRWTAQGGWRRDRSWLIDPPQRAETKTRSLLSLNPSFLHLSRSSRSLGRRKPLVKRAPPPLEPHSSRRQLRRRCRRQPPSEHHPPPAGWQMAMGCLLSSTGQSQPMAW